MAVVVLCHHDDEPAHWATVGLCRRGLGLEVVLATDLVGARRWTACQDDHGTRWEVELSDGRELCSDRINGALNRLTHLPVEWLSHVAYSDRDYAGQEWFALFLAFLADIHGLVLNPPTPRWLAGHTGHPLEWRYQAKRCGLPVMSGTWDADSPRQVVEREGQREMAVVICDYVSAPKLPASYRKRCVALAHRVGCPLLQLEFVIDPESCYFVDATPVVDFRLAGEAGLDHLYEVFRAREAPAR